MISIKELRTRLSAGGLDQDLSRLRCVSGEALTSERRRLSDVLDQFCAAFGAEDATAVTVCSAPGRTELGGNHTDHQRGRVLAASVNLDILACAAVNGTDSIRILSQGWPMVTVDLSRLEPVEEEKGTTAALVRGMAARAVQLGHKVSGFDAYAVSDVLPGSGLSSSAAYEVLVGVLINHLFCGDAFDPVTIAQMGQYAENVFFDKPCGLMDQMASSVGGAVAIDFEDPKKPIVRQVKVDLEKEGYALCIIDSGADHADLTAEYAAIPAEMKAVAASFGKEVLRQVPQAEFYDRLPQLRKEHGDRAVLRAMHFYADDRRAAAEADALASGDFGAFLGLVKESGYSSWMYLQDVIPAGWTTHQEMAVALATAERALGGRGAFRVHGGGFAGTIQAFVPLDMLEDFRIQVERVLGEGRCHILSIRPVGGTVLVP